MVAQMTPELKEGLDEIEDGLTAELLRIFKLGKIPEQLIGTYPDSPLDSLVGLLETEMSEIVSVLIDKISDGAGDEYKILARRSFRKALLTALKEAKERM